MPSVSAWLRRVVITFAAGVGLYLTFLGLLTIRSLQDYVIYLHGVTLTWFQDVDVPEQWGFLRNQVTPFHLNTPDGETLHAWHILPLETYRQNEEHVRAEEPGLCRDIRERLAFQLLRDDPTSQLVIYLHGAAGTLGSGWRPQSYRALSASAQNVHVISVDYRGFGTSTGWPSEVGLLTDALTVANFALETLGLPSERIVVFGQSLGTAVGIALAHHLAGRSPPVLFAGMVLVAPFADVELLTRTYRVAGTRPLLGPVARVPHSLPFFNKFIVTKWPSKDTLSAFIRQCGSAKLTNRRKKYDITLIHAQDDYDIPWVHSEIVFWHAVTAMSDPDSELTFDELEDIKATKRLELGAGGRQVDWRSKEGIITEQIVKHGSHDKIMSYPIASLAVARGERGPGVMMDPREERKVISLLSGLRLLD